jgi:hypothetical protein
MSHRFEQWANGFESFVPHVRDPEAFAFDFPVASFVLETVLLSELFVKLCNVDV